MKVLHIITGLNDGGAEAVLYRMCKFDSENQHTVISLMDEGKYGSLLKKLNINVHTLNMPNGKIKLSALRKLFRLIRQIKPDVIQTWMYHADLIGGVIGRLAGVKNIVWGVHHTTLVKGESKRSTILIAKMNALLSKFIPKNIIYCAEKSREVQESIGFKASKGVVVPNGYDINDFTPDEISGKAFRAEFSISDDTFLIGHVGRYDPQKDHQNLISALELLKKNGHAFKAILVGTNLDNDNQTLINSIVNAELENDVLLIGRRNDIPAVMNAFDAFVLSSAFGEAFPNVLNEAMACGTPCVTTDVGDAAVIVGDTGWVVPAKDGSLLSKAIHSAMELKQNRPEAWQQKQHDARERIVDNFSIVKMINSYKAVWALGIKK